MAKNIYICSRRNLPESVENRLHEICKKLAPDNITVARSRVVVTEHIAYGIMNPTKTLLESGNSLLMGQIFGNNEKWAEPLTAFPDGSYALFRDGGKYCELVTDALATRTIWYYLDENLFIGSTSQRAIVMFLGTFEFDERVVPWVLSTGTLGPVFSWDKRIKHLPADSSVVLDKDEWRLSLTSNSIGFSVSKRTGQQYETQLRDALETTFKSLKLDFSYWALPLSGGYDSRAILCFLKKTGWDIAPLKTVTWGLQSSAGVKGSDAYVARELAKKLNVKHKYYHTDLSDEPVDNIINRFILLGEGRIDHLPGYMDGFKIWKTLFEDQIQGVIRGDEVFGWLSVSSPLTVRILLNCCLCSDFSNLKDYRKYGFPSQELPQYLQQRKEETLEVWRDRLYQEYRLPTMLSALADLKFGYVEQISPFLSKVILQVVRQLPDHLRTNKALFSRIASSISPDVDYAVTDSTATPKDLLRQKQVVAIIKDELSSNFAKTIFPGEFLDFIQKGIKSQDQKKSFGLNPSSLKASVTRVLPRFVKNAIRDKISLPAVDPNMLAFRLFLVSKMNKILKEDCQVNLE
jgi:hypothetical protein